MDLPSGGLNLTESLLIDSLIRQEIDHVFEYKRNEELISFNPSSYQVIEESEPFSAASGLLSAYYMKEPSKLQMARQLLYKEFLMALPDLYSIEEAYALEKKIITYIDHAFDSAD